MKLSDYIADFLVQKNVRHIFQIIGGASVHMVHSMADRKELTVLCMQHEQVAAMAAEAYARITKNIGVAMATSGPGMTNLITGIGCAYFDSIPLICITGQVNRDESRNGRKVRQIGFQETDIVDIVAPLTKHSVQVKNPEDIRYVLEEAVHIATSGRPGPVLIDIPMDIQRADINPKKLKGYTPKKASTDTDSVKEIRDAVVHAAKLVKNAQRPVVIAGGAVRYADVVDDFRKLIKQLSVPVVATWSGIDTVDHTDPQYIGQIGVYGSRAANFTVQNSDCIISFGSRLDTRITGGRPDTFARFAKKIVIDIDRAELYKKRGLDPDVGICADVSAVIPLFSSQVAKQPLKQKADWMQQAQQWKEAYPAVLPAWRKRKTLIDPYFFIETLSQQVKKNALVVTDCGANLSWTIQAFQIHDQVRLWSAMGNSPMGYAVAAAIGAQFAEPKKQVVSIIGDGGFQMNIQDLQTIVHYKLPVKIFIINNNSYGIIKQFQDVYFDGKHIATEAKTGYSVPDFKKVVSAYGISYVSLASHTGLARKITHVLSMKGPVVCDVHIPEGAHIIPKLEFGKPIEELSPLLDEKEVVANMIALQ